MMDPHHILNKMSQMPGIGGGDNEKIIDEILRKIEESTAHMVKHPSGNEEVRGQIRRYHIANNDDRFMNKMEPGDEKYLKAKPEWPLVMAFGTIKGPGGVTKFEKRIR